jgi:hypothetical protein
MKRITLALLVLGLAGGLASSQVWLDTFTYPPGTTIGSWAEFLGDWNAVNNTAESEQKRAYQYLTQPNKVYQDCAVECLVYYNPKSSQALQFGGPTFRCNNPAGNTDLIHVKVQDNNSNGAFDSIWVYDRPGSATSKTGITPEFKSAVVRLLGIDTRVVAKVDVDLDGKWDHILNKTTAVPLKAGPVGLCAYGGAQMDDFEIYDGVILNNTNNPLPQPGATQKFVLRGKASTAYQAATSFGNTGVPLPDGRVIPLTADSLFFLSISGMLPSVFVGYGGTLDGNGDGNIGMILPNIPALVGITLYTGFVAYDAAGIINISNDLQTTIVP